MFSGWWEYVWFFLFLLCFYLCFPNFYIYYPNMFFWSCCKCGTEGSVFHISGPVSPGPQYALPWNLLDESNLCVLQAHTPGPSDCVHSASDLWYTLVSVILMAEFLRARAWSKADLGLNPGTAICWLCVLCHLVFLPNWNEKSNYLKVLMRTEWDNIPKQSFFKIFSDLSSWSISILWTHMVLLSISSYDNLLLS